MAETGQRWRWHDLHGAYIRRLAMAVPGRIVQQMARHLDFSTTQRYIAVTDQALADAAEIASRLAAGVISGSTAKIPHPISTPNFHTGKKTRKRENH